MRRRRRVVDARDVLDPNARTRAPFDARIVGHWERLGPDAWDPYALVASEGGPVRVFAGVEVQLEPVETAFRMRLRGRVVQVAWSPGAEEAADIASLRTDTRSYFVSRLLEGYASPPALGVAAVVARKLNEEERLE